MSDSKQMKGPRDSSRINLEEDYEVSYWTKTLNISKSQLEDVVKKYGPMVKDVKTALNKNT